ncbi:hypothetical protein BCR36DRAFT_298948, partial [Piromyces finnis]
KMNKNSPDSGTCNNKYYSNFFEGINYQTKDTFFFAFIIQFILVSLMYFFVGAGKYWKVLYYTSIAGLIGSIIENFTLAYICQESQLDNNSEVYTFFISEIFWIINEFAVPILNIIKIETLSNGKVAIIIRYIILILSIPFSVTRFYIGYDRMIKGYLNTNVSRIGHGIAFGILGVSDSICSIFIIFFSRYKHKTSIIRNSKISNLMKISGFTILLIVDFVSIVLSILYIISTIFPNNKNLESSTTLFHCLKSVFILILATDALMFKYSAVGTYSFEIGNSTSISISTTSRQY